MHLRFAQFQATAPPSTPRKTPQVNAEGGQADRCLPRKRCRRCPVAVTAARYEHMALLRCEALSALGAVPPIIWLTSAALCGTFSCCCLG
jgi:hypothetical protein